MEIKQICTSLETFDWTSANPYLFGKWKAIFAGINRCNSVLNVIGQVEGADFSAKEGEARFLRAHFNFELQKMFGECTFYLSREFSELQNSINQTQW